MSGLRAEGVEVAAGELVLLTGEDGCGTSTLLRALAAREPAALLLAAPPGEEWDDHDVAGELAPPDLLVALGLSSPPEREMWMLSGGERQRVRLARALAADAPVLLLDEPLGYLDAAGVRTVLARLRARAEQGAAVLLVAKAHPQAEAAADRVLVLQDGALRPGP